MGTANTAVLIALASTVGASCSSSESVPAADDAGSIGIEAGPDGVVFELGSYDVGGNIDQVVSGPDIVIYGDGSVYRDTIRLAPDAEHRFQRSELTERRVLDIVAAARDLPDVVDRDECGVDEFETELRIENRTWTACGLFDAPEFGSFLDAVRSDVDSLDMAQWRPSAVVQHALGAQECSVVETSTLPPYQTAPVYPHASDEYPLGEFPCPWATP